jgi:tape measure domain-containing protein
MNITKGVNQAIAISGATSQEASNSLIQFSQGLAAGALRGDELRSVVEQFPRLADAIAKGFNTTGGALAAFAKENEGILLTEKVIESIRKALPELAGEFSQIQITAGGAFQRFNNSLTLFIGGIAKSVRLGQQLDRVLQAVARNLPQITVVLASLAGIVVFNLLTSQLIRLGAAAKFVLPFIIGLFQRLGSVLAIVTKLAARFVFVLFANPLVLGFTLVIGGIVAAFLALKNTVGSILPDFLDLGRIFEFISAVALTAVETIRTNWTILGKALKEIFLEAMNFVLRFFTNVVNSFIKGLNIIGKAANALGASFGEIDLIDAFQFDTTEVEGSMAMLPS